MEQSKGRRHRVDDVMQVGVGSSEFLTSPSFVLIDAGLLLTEQVSVDRILGEQTQQLLEFAGQLVEPCVGSVGAGTPQSSSSSRRR